MFDRIIDEIMTKLVQNSSQSVKDELKNLQREMLDPITDSERHVIKKRKKERTLLIYFLRVTQFSTTVIVQQREMNDFLAFFSCRFLRLFVVNRL